MTKRIILTVLLTGLLASASAAQADQVQIALSTKVITSDTYTPGDTSFQAGEPIYARIYVSDGKSFKSHQNDPGSPLKFSLQYVKYENDNDFNDYYQLQLDAKQLAKSYADVTVLPGSGSPTQVILHGSANTPAALVQEFVNRLVYKCEELKAETVPVRLSLGSWGRTDFEIKCSKDGLAKAQEAGKKGNLAMLDAKRMTKPGMKNKGLEKKILDAARKNPDRTGISKKTKVLRVVITSDDWQVDRNERDVIISQSVWADVAYKTDDAAICNVETVHISQDYVGRKFKGKFYVPGTSMGTEQILCKNVGK